MTPRPRRTASCHRNGGRAQGSAGEAKPRKTTASKAAKKQPAKKRRRRRSSKKKPVAKTAEKA
jgi:hypothetical protein